jgi:magnesium transporter
VFLCFKAARYIAGETGLAEEQISLFWRGRTVLVFQENEEDTLAPVIDRIRRGKGRVRNAGPDYLAAVLLDLAADTYSAALAALSEQVELFEEEVMRRPDRDTITRIYEVQREVLALRNSVLPLKDMLARLLRGELGELRDETEPYLRDVMDHALQAEDGVDSLHALLGGLMDMHISLSGMRMNEIMKVLTVIATIFIPLTFIVGVYGMNFAYMPELQWRYGYFLVLALMAAVAVIMLLYFRRKRWL